MTYLYWLILLIPAVLIAVEACLRVFSPQPPSRLSIYRRHPRLPLFALEPDATAHVSTGETSFTVRTDPRGFRVGNTENESNSRCDVLVVGGTNTFGYGVNFEESFVGLLERNLTRVHISNAAVPTYGPVQYRMVLEDIIEGGFAPNTIVVGFCPGTDFNHALLSKDIHPARGSLPSGSRIKNSFSRHLHLYRLISSSYHRYLSSNEDPRMREWEKYLYEADAWIHGPLMDATQIVREEVGRIHELAVSTSSRLLFVIVPTASMVSYCRANRSARDRTDRRSIPLGKIHAILGDLGIEFVDTTSVLAALPVGGSHHRFDRHLTRLANQVVYSEIAHVFN